MDLFDLATLGATEGLWDWDLASSRVYYSRRWISMLGYAESEFGNTPEDWFKKIHPEDFEPVRREIDSHLENNSPQFEIQHRMLHKDGSYRWLICRGVVTRDEAGRAVRIAGCHSDITGGKVVDALTGLPNRLLLLDRLTRSIETSKRRSPFLFAVLILDLDRPEFLLDRIGSTDGDLLVIAVARRLETCLRAGDTVARLGRDHVIARSSGGEFIILIDGLNGVGEAKTVAERLLNEIAAPFELNGREVFLSASIGIALSATGYRGAEEALRDADTALHRAKSLGKSRCEVFDTAILESAQARLQLESEFREALRRQEFEVLYQPIVSLTSHQIAGFEALVRWNHPVRGVISPSEFIPIAEKTGFIIPLGRWVLHEACHQLKAWREDYGGARDLWLSVNISSFQFMQPSFAKEIHKVLLDVDLDANGLMLELTETAVMENPEAAGSVLMQLRVMGVRIALDDFGTGYSSLAHLRRFPVDFLKIDHSFMRSIETSHDALEIIGTISGLAHRLGLCVIAEGVESARQLELIRPLGCEYAQGFLFSAAVSREKADTLLKYGFAVTEESKGPTAVMDRNDAENRTSSRPLLALDAPDATPIVERKRSYRLREIAALIGLTALILLFMGGLFARFNSTTSPPVALTSPPSSSAISETAVGVPKPADMSPTRQNSDAPSAKTGADLTHVKAKTARENPPAPVYIYPVVHGHVWGSCKGNLKITSEAISFISEKDKDSFNLAYSDCSYALERDRLTIKAGSRTYRFTAASGLTKEENRSRLQEIVHTISTLHKGPASK